MPKSSLMAAVEKISERISRKILRECKAFGTMGTWIKALQDDNRNLKHRVKELEIRVKKLNTYGPTPPDPVKKSTGAKPTSVSVRTRKMTPAQMRKIRTDRGFSQSQMALLLGIKTSRYSNWENGASHISQEFEEQMKELRDMKASELRTRMHNVGIFQPNGKPITPKRKKEKSKREAGTALNVSAEPESNALYLSPIMLRELREKMGLSRRQLSLLLGIKSSRYTNWERGISKAAPMFMEKIMEFSEMSTSDLAVMIDKAKTEVLVENKIQNGKPQRKTEEK